MPTNRPKLGEVRAAEGAGAAELTTREREKTGGYRRFLVTGKVIVTKLGRRLEMMNRSLVHVQFIPRVVQSQKTRRQQGTFRKESNYLHLIGRVARYHKGEVIEEGKWRGPKSFLQ